MHDWRISKNNPGSAFTRIGSNDLLYSCVISIGWARVSIHFKRVVIAADIFHILPGLVTAGVAIARLAVPLLLAQQ